MKISWGTSIVLAMIGFIAFIMFMVVTMMTDEKYSYDLVVEDYYKTEVGFQDQLNRTQNSSHLSTNIKIEKADKGLLVHFPADLDFSKIKGSVFLYRPSNKELDSEIPLALDSHHILIPDKYLINGRWNVIVDWQYEQEKYYFKKDILY